MSSFGLRTQAVVIGRSIYHKRRSLKRLELKPAGSGRSGHIYPLPSLLIPLIHRRVTGQGSRSDPCLFRSHQKGKPLTPAALNGRFHRTHRRTKYAATAFHALHIARTALLVRGKNAVHRAVSGVKSSARRIIVHRCAEAIRRRRHRMIGHVTINVASRDGALRRVLNIRCTIPAPIPRIQLLSLSTGLSLVVGTLRRVDIGSWWRAVST